MDQKLMTRYKSQGKIRVGNKNIVVDIDKGIYFFYRSLIPKAIRPNPQKYNPHISVVRNEDVLLINRWKDDDGKFITFQYDTTIHNCDKYFWINVYSKDIEDVRVNLGLPPVRYSSFHITLGNLKG